MTADFRLEPPATPEEKVIRTLRDWMPPGGWGKLTVEIEYENGVPKYMTQIDGRPTVKLG